MKGDSRVIVGIKFRRRGNGTEKILQIELRSTKCFLATKLELRIPRKFLKCVNMNYPWNEENKYPDC